MADALAPRTWLKIHRAVEFDSPLFENGRIVETGRETFGLIRPIITEEG